MESAVLIGLGLTIILELAASAGWLVLLPLLHPERMAGSAAVALYLGVLVMIACFHAGNLCPAERSKKGALRNNAVDWLDHIIAVGNRSIA